MALGAIADGAGDRQRAIAYYRKVLDADSDFAPAANNLAWDYASLDSNLDQALELAQRARRLSPKDPHIADTLGFVMLKRGIASAAVPLLREGVDGLPRSPSTHYHLGLALLSTDQPAEASGELATALKLDPNSRDADDISRALSRANEAMRGRRLQRSGQPG
jgi:tetratricopeptide (TPR) repeat protein